MKQTVKSWTLGPVLGCSSLFAAVILAAALWGNMVLVQELDHVERIDDFPQNQLLRQELRISQERMRSSDEKERAADCDQATEESPMD